MRVSFQRIEVTLARMVMPRSRSRSFESMARSTTRWFSRKAPDCCNSRSTSVVLPWSTWAMIATLRSCMGLKNQARAPIGPRRAVFAAQYSQQARESNACISSAGGPAPRPEPHAFRQRLLHHHHLGNCLAGDKAGEPAGAVGYADRRRLLFLQQFERLLERYALADGGEIRAHRVGYARVGAERLQRADQRRLVEQADGSGGVVDDGKFALARLQQCLHSFINVGLRRQRCELCHHCVADRHATRDR